mgnify:CR=1 FL=1
MAKAKHPMPINTGIDKKDRQAIADGMTATAAFKKYGVL